MLLAKLAELSGNPRDACSRFLRQSGVSEKRSYREWTKPEQQRLLDLITAMPVEEAAKMLHRPAGSVRSMLHRLGHGRAKPAVNGSPSSHCPGRCTLAPTKYRNGSIVGWLRSRTLTTAGAHAHIIDADDFCEFVKQHGRDVVGRRLTYDALWFVRNYVFPPSHAELLSVRGTYKKHDAGDETGANTESQSACGSEEGA